MFAHPVKGARSLALSPAGTLFVGSGREGLVHAVLDRDKDGVADEVIQVAGGLNWPNGVAFRDGALYVAEISRILRYDGIEGALRSAAEAGGGERQLSEGRASRLEVHRLRPGRPALRAGGRALQHLPARGPLRLDHPARRPTAAGREVFARGVRNTVGFDWHPRTKELWFTDNGRDMLGDDIPPDELNHAPAAGAALRLSRSATPERSRDPEFGAQKPCADTRPPAQKLGPHVAALGMRFYTGAMFPAEYREQIFIAEHGSWNRSKKIGYRLSLVAARRQPGVVLRDVRGRLAAGRRRSGAGRSTCW